MSDEVLVKVDNVSKKFCRNLKKSLWYGLEDMATELTGNKSDHELRSDEFWSVKDVSFELKRGECLGLVGPNGAGKSTLLKMLNGLIKPDRGSITLKGRVGALLELGAGFNPILSGLENIYNQGAVLGLTKKEIDDKLDAIIEFAEIGDFLDMPVQNYSSGMKVRLGFGVASQLEPDVLIIDEVLAVGDIGFQAKCFNTIYQMLKNSAVIFVSHSMPQVSRICSDVMVINHGQKVFLGKDVAEGIQKFYSFFKKDNPQGIITGNGKATIYEIKLESNGCLDVKSINYLDELIVNLKFSIIPDIFRFDVVITIMSQELQTIMYCSSYFNQQELTNIRDVMTLVVNLGSMNLSPGIYTLTVLILSAKHGEILCKHYNVNQFEVINQNYCGARIQLQAQWSSISSLKNSSTLN